MIKVFLESDKFSHKAGVTKHATNRLARKSHQCTIIIELNSLYLYLCENEQVTHIFVQQSCSDPMDPGLM